MYLTQEELKDYDLNMTGYINDEKRKRCAVNIYTNIWSSWAKYVKLTDHLHNLNLNLYKIVINENMLKAAESDREILSSIDIMDEDEYNQLSNKSKYNRKYVMDGDFYTYDQIYKYLKLVKSKL